MEISSLCSSFHGLLLPSPSSPSLPRLRSAAQASIKPRTPCFPSLASPSSSSFFSPVSAAKTVLVPLRPAGNDDGDGAEDEEGEGAEREVQAPPRIEPVFSMRTPYNDITILEVPKRMNSDLAGSKLLLLDNSGNIHSIYKDASKWTGLYWDQFATLPPIIPDGPIAILGLGGGTSARLMLDIWPSCKLLGWEIDGVLIDAARDHFGLAELEVPTSEGGVLEVFIDDALQASATTDGGFAGIIVDLYANGEILPQLKQPDTWQSLKEKLKAGGRIMVNCGGICVEKSDPKSQVDDGTWTWEDGGYAKEATLKSMSRVFPQLLFRKLGGDSSNFMALTGPLPDLPTWASALPKELQKGLSSWRTCSL